MSDPNFANVSLLLHGNGTNGSTTIIDSSSNGHAVTANGNAQISTSAPKYGSGALLFDGTTDYLTIPAHSSFNLGTGDLTVEFWLKTTATAQTILIGTNALWTNSGEWLVQLNGGDISGRFQVFLSGNNVFGSIDGTGTNDGSWHHVAFVKYSSTYGVWVDGIHKTSGGNTAAWGSSTVGLRIGDHFSFPTRCLNGRLDDIRITKGVSRYVPTNNFTPPTAEFPDASPPTLTQLKRRSRATLRGMRGMG